MPLYRHPPPPPNQRRRLVISAEAITGTGAADQTIQSASGTGLEEIGGTGAATGAAAMATGSGTSLQTFTGTGAGTQAISLAAGVGVELITGSGDSSPPPASSSGSGTSILAITGTGAGTQAAQTTSGGGTGGAVTAGRLSQAPVEVAVAPNSAARLSQGAVEVVVAKADPKARLSTLAVEAIVGREVVGAELAIDAIIEAPIFIPTASTVPVYDPVYSETGYYDLLLDPDVYGEDAGAQAVAITGVGAGTQAAQSAAGSGAAGAVGTGAGTQVPQSGSGSGVVAQPVTGVGAGTQVPQSGSGTGVVPVVGTGAGTQAPQSGSGSGLSVVPVTGTGAGTQVPQGGIGSGLVLQPVTGTGAGTQAPQTSVGIGLVSQPVTGTGAGTQAAQGATGAGLVAMPVTGTGAGTQPAGNGYGAGLALVIPPPEVTTSVIVIRVDGVDITDHIRHSDAMFVSQVNGTAGTCQFAVRDLGHDQSFVFGQTINLEIDGILRWSGFLQTIDRQYTTYVVDTSDPDATARWFLITGSDVNILFSRRVTYDRAHPRRLTALSPPPVYRDAVHADQWEEDTPSDAVVKYFITHYTDMLSDGVGLGGVQNLGSPNPDWAAAYAAAQTVGDFMRAVNSLLGGIWYLTPNKTLVHRAVETATTPKYLSDYDDGNPNRVGVRDYTLVSDATQMINDAHVWGTAAGVSIVRHSRAQDAASIAEHGRWQGGEFNQSMYKQASLDNRSEALIYGNDASRHGAKDDKLVAQATVYTTDFYLGDVVTCYSHVYEDGAGHSSPYESADVLTAILPIRRIVTTFPTSTSVRFDLLLTQELDEPWSIYEFKFPKFKPPSGTPIPKGPNIKLPPVVVVGGCTDAICGITDTFNRPDAPIPGKSDEGSLWTTSLSAGSIVDIVGNRLHLKSGSWAGSFYNPTIAQLQASTMSGRLVYTPVNISGTPMARIQMTHSSLSFINAAGSTNQIQVTRGSTTTMGSFALTAGTSYNVEWEEDATSSRWRIWAVGSTAPTGWTITGTGAASPAVQVGVILHINTLVQHECYIENLDLDGVNRCTAPNFDHFNRTASNGWGVAQPSGARWRLWPYEPGNVPPSWWASSGIYVEPSRTSVSGGIGRINTAAGAAGSTAGESYIYDPVMFDKLPLTIQFDVNADVEVDFWSGDGYPGPVAGPYSYITIGSYQPWRDGIYTSVPGAGFDENITNDLEYTPGFEEYFDGGGAWPASNPILRCKWEIQERSMRVKWWRIGTPEPDWMHGFVMDEDTPPEITYHGMLKSLGFGWFTGQGLIMYDNLSFDYSGSACYPCGPGAGAFYDSFNRSTSNGSLGTADSGSTWQFVGGNCADQRVDGTRLLFATGAATGRSCEFEILGPGPWAYGSDFTLTMRIEMNVSNNRDRLGLAIGLGHPSERTWLGLKPRATGALALTVAGDTSDNEVLLTPGSLFGYGEALLVKWEHTTTVSRAKLWKASGTEPVDWQVERSTVGDQYGAGHSTQTDSFSLYFQGSTSLSESGFNTFIDSIAIDRGSGTSGGGCSDQAMIVIDDFNDRTIAANGGGPGATGDTSGTGDPWYTPSAGTAPATYAVEDGAMKVMVPRDYPGISQRRAFLTLNNGGSDYYPYYLAGGGFPNEMVSGDEIDYQLDFMFGNFVNNVYMEIWLVDGYQTDYEGIGVYINAANPTTGHYSLDGYSGSGPVVNFAFVGETWYTMRVRAVGGVASVKIWPTASVEPATWGTTSSCKPPPWPTPGELSIAVQASSYSSPSTAIFYFDNLIRRESSEVTTGETASGIPLYGEVWETIQHSGGNDFATTRAWTGPLQVWVNGAIVTAFTSSPSLGEFHLTSSISSSATLRVRYQANGDPA